MIKKTFVVFLLVWVGVACEEADKEGEKKPAPTPSPTVDVLDIPTPIAGSFDLPALEGASGHLVFAVGSPGEEILYVAAFGGTTRAIGITGDFSIAPDGHTLAHFVSDPADPNWVTLALTDLTTGTTRVLPDTDILPRAIQWSPDGTWLAYRHWRQIGGVATPETVVTTESGETVFIYGTDPPAYLPTLVVVKADGSRTLMPELAPRHIGWLTDGSLLVITESVPETIWRFDPALDEAQLLDDSGRGFEIGLALNDPGRFGDGQAFLQGFGVQLAPPLAQWKEAGFAVAPDLGSFLEVPRVFGEAGCLPLDIIRKGLLELALPEVVYQADMSTTVEIAPPLWVDGESFLFKQYSSATCELETAVAALVWVQGETAQTIAEEVGAFALSPDGRFVVWERDGLYLTELATGVTGQILPAAAYSAVAWGE